MPFTFPSLCATSLRPPAASNSPHRPLIMLDDALSFGRVQRRALLEVRLIGTI